MIVVIDSSALVFLINPEALPPVDPSTGQLLDRGRERIDNFVATLSSNDTIVIPTPVLAEVLVKAGEGGPDLHVALGMQARVRIEAFDERAAVELALLTREAVLAGDKKSGSDQPAESEAGPANRRDSPRSRRRTNLC